MQHRSVGDGGDARHAEHSRDAQLRETIAAWLCSAPVSQTTATAPRNSGVHDGSVIGHTSTSPGSSSRGSAGSRITRAGPDAVPPLTAIPLTVAPADGASGWASTRNGHVSGSEMCPSNHDGGMRSSR